MNSLNNVTFTKRELLDIYADFVDRLVNDFGNDRDEVIKYHIDKLVNKPYRRVKQLRPRGPRGGWLDLMCDVNGAMEDLAVQKSTDPRSKELQIQHAHQEREMVKRVGTILREEGYDYPRALAELLVKRRSDLRYALGF